MNIRARAAGKALEEIIDQFRLEIADSSRSHPSLDDGHRAAAEVHGREAKGFVHGHQKISGSQDAAPVPQRAVKRLTQADADILDGVVLIHIQVAQCGELQIEAAVTGE